MFEDIRKSHINRLFALSVVLLLVFGLLTVFSASYNPEEQGMSSFFERQVIWVLLGLIACGIGFFTPLNIIKGSVFALYGFLILLLLLLEVIPHGSSSSTRWFSFGFVQFQPSEFMKPILVLTLARFLTDRFERPNDIRTLALYFSLVLLPFALVLKQPDLGTSLVFIAVTIPLLYWRGLSPLIIFILCSPFFSFIASFNFWSFFFVIILISAVIYLSKRTSLIFWAVFGLNIFVGILAPILWNKLHDYQQKRVLTFLGLITDPKGVGYQIIQSKVAIGSGGLFGKGFLEGTQTQLRFLPAQHTDFIFSVLAEEWGFGGSILFLAILFLFLQQTLKIASAIKDPFASLVVVGFVTIFGFQAFVNIGMTLGIMPVTGIPLPFISYGGSSMISSMLMVGIIANISRSRFT